MRTNKFKAKFSLFVALLMLFVIFPIAFAKGNTIETLSNQFGDILYADKGVTVFYGNPLQNEIAAKAIEEKAARGLQHDQIWVNANSSSDTTMGIWATSNNPITYYTVRQETTYPLYSSHIYMHRPDGTVCFIWEMNSDTQEIGGRVVGTNILPNKAYAWTSGQLTLRWKVETGSSGARMNLWAW